MSDLLISDLLITHHLLVYSRLTIHEHHSVLKLFTGFAMAALID